MMRQRGFTLLELLIAVAIFAILSAFAYGGLNSVLKTSQKTQEKNRSLQALQLAVGVIHQDMTQITNRDIRDENGARQFAVKSGGSYEYLIQFTRRGWRNPAEQVRSSMQRVAYRLDEKTLVREYWKHLDRGPGAETTKLPLLEGVTEVEIRYMDKKNQWQQEWPPMSGIANPNPGLPRAIELTLSVEKWGDIKRLFAVNP